MAGAHPGTHLEIEVKLDADPGFALPELAGLPGVGLLEESPPELLEAVYLDSTDLRLISAGTTLRRRTGGADAGWHLKLPTASGLGRLEVRLPLGRADRAIGRTVPARLRALTRARLRGAALEPVARIVTRRVEHRLLADGGALLAVIAVDAVTAQALPDGEPETWHELEVELAGAGIGGDPGAVPELLERTRDRLIAAGARPSTAGSKLARALAGRLAPPDAALPPDPADADPDGVRPIALSYLRTQVGVLLLHDPLVRLDRPDAVHQMRVATRRLRSALATFRGAFPPESGGEQLRSELAWLAGLLGAARDLEVMRELLLAELDRQPAELVIGPVRRRVDQELTRDYRAAHVLAVRALDGERYVRLLEALHRFPGTPGGTAPHQPGTPGGTAPHQPGTPGGTAPHQPGTPGGTAPHQPGTPGGTAPHQPGTPGPTPSAPAAAIPEPTLPTTPTPTTPTPNRPPTGQISKRTAGELRKLVARAHRRLLHTLRDADAAPTPAEREVLLHEARKAAKRSRYAAEAVTAAVGPRARGYAKAAAGVQEVLGAHQDAVVLRPVVLDLAGRAYRAGESTFSYGRLHARLEAATAADAGQVTAAVGTLRVTAVRWPG